MLSKIPYRIISCILEYIEHLHCVVIRANGDRRRANEGIKLNDIHGKPLSKKDKEKGKHLTIRLLKNVYCLLRFPL